MSKRTVNKTGWGMSRWMDDIVVSSIRGSRDECLFDYAREHPEKDIFTLFEMGYECVEVTIATAD